MGGDIVGHEVVFALWATPPFELSRPISAFGGKAAILKSGLRAG